MSDTAKKILKEVWEWFYTLALAIIVAFLIKGFLFDIVKVDGLSMYPTLNHNDRLIISKIGYTPKQRDIVILDSTYKVREEYYDALAEEDGKDELGAISKAIEYFSLPKSLKHKYYVKRIIALPGQTVDIKDGNVYVDGKLFNEPYFKGVTNITDHSVSYPLTVDEGMVFVMGDNRSNSEDSRSSRLGQVPFEAVVGKAQFRFFPFNEIGITR